jgi:hypothetical protein
MGGFDFFGLDEVVGNVYDNPDLLKQREDTQK